jgi:23S rRNA (cytidine1920-2'-O)/16S rRNA (cytidine1409-2'-O)-methyltransferase
VKVDGARVTKVSTMIKPGSLIEVDAPARSFVSRGGNKLQAALDAFAIDVSGFHCLDVGSSTGGFTDCLLQAGAARVVCIDVGTDQLHPDLRVDERVTVREQTSIRGIDPASIGGPFDLVVVDLSFISVCSVAPDLAAVTPGRAIVLCKPQFEVGQMRLGKKGVVKNEAYREEAVQSVIDCLAEAGLGTKAILRSPITGGDGNIEYLLLVDRAYRGSTNLSSTIGRVE